jgi:hypothetical protein
MVRAQQKSVLHPGMVAEGVANRRGSRPQRRSLRHAQVMKEICDTEVSKQNYRLCCIVAPYLAPYAFPVRKVPPRGG